MEHAEICTALPPLSELPNHQTGGRVTICCKITHTSSSPSVLPWLSSGDPSALWHQPMILISKHQYPTAASYALHLSAPNRHRNHRIGKHLRPHHCRTGI